MSEFCSIKYIVRVIIKCANSINNIKNMASLTGLSNVEDGVIEVLMKLWSPDFNFIEYLEKFQDEETVVNKIDFVYEELKKSKLLPRLIPDRKNDETSEELRQKGNKLYQIKDYQSAFDHYVYSILVAASKTNQSLAYANRSSIMIMSNLYEECIEDIDRALALDYPDHLKSKVIDRRRVASDKTYKTPPYHEPLPEIPENVRNSKIPGASNAIQIVKDDPHFGTHIIAAEDLIVGQVLLIEKPYISTATQLGCDYPSTSHCCECDELCPNLIPCPNCTKAMYCGDQCKNKAFEHYHKYECPILKTITEFLPTEFGRHFLIALRMAFKLRDNYQDFADASQTTTTTTTTTTEEEVYESGFREIFNLKSCLNYTLPDREFCAALMIAKIFHLVKTNTKFFKEAPEKRPENIFKEIMYKTIFISNLNTHTVTELVKVRLGDNECNDLHNNVSYGLYPITSLFAYSCVPNVVAVCHGNTLVVKTVKPIKKGEMCFTVSGSNFTLANELTNDRANLEDSDHDHLRSEVFRNRNLVCNCIRCVPEKTILNPEKNAIFNLFQLHLPTKMLDPIRNACQNAEELKRLIEHFTQQLQSLQPADTMYYLVSDAIRYAFIILGNNRMIGPNIVC